jgi:hypothetical protein
MTRTPGSFSNRRRTVSSLKLHLSATSATEKCCSIAPVSGCISRTDCDVALIAYFNLFGTSQGCAAGAWLFLQSCDSLGNFRCDFDEIQQVVRRILLAEFRWPH